VETETTEPVGEEATTTAPESGTTVAPEASVGEQAVPHPAVDTQVVVREAMIEDVASLCTAPMPEVGCQAVGVSSCLMMTSLTWISSR
jgi:hypothetical protein